MTTKLKGFTVALEMDIREDDAEQIKNAIESLRFVEAVQPIEATGGDWIVATRIRRDLGRKILDILTEDKD